MLYAELESAGNMADNLQMLGASMDKANSIDDTPVMDIDGAELTTADASVEFQDVSFAYGDRTILDHVSLTVPSGSITAVVGPSGGGKTTLCNLIARFWDVQGGKITVGGHDVREYKLDSLMKNISMVFQSVYLFNDTVENNIKFGRPDATTSKWWPPLGPPAATTLSWHCRMDMIQSWVREAVHSPVGKSSASPLPGPC